MGRCGKRRGVEAADGIGNESSFLKLRREVEKRSRRTHFDVERGGLMKTKM